MAASMSSKTSKDGSEPESLEKVLELLKEVETGPETPSSYFSRKLRRIREMGPKHEAAIWIGLARSLDTKEHEFYPDFVKNDFLRRNFDATQEALGQLFAQEAKPHKLEDGSEERRIDLKGICELGVNCFGFVQGETRQAGSRDFDHPAIDALSQVVELPCSKLSFQYIIRSLRVGKLLAMMQEAPFVSSTTLSGKDELYYYDYDVRNISGSFVPTRSMKIVPGRRRKFTIPAVSPQIPMGSGFCSSLEEYLFTDHLFGTRDSEGVHWLHAQNPGDKILLALAQHFSLPSNIMDRLTRLYEALPIVNYRDGPARSEIGENSKSAVEERLKMNCGVDELLNWAIVVLPAVHLSVASREDLGTYHKWFWKRDVGSSKELPPPPTVRVAAIVSNLALVWARSDWSIVMSVSSEPTYLGKWVSDDPSHQAFSIWRFLEDIWRFFTRFACCCCSARMYADSWWYKHMGYQPLQQEDAESDEELAWTSRPSTPTLERTLTLSEHEEADGDQGLYTFKNESEELVGFRVPKSQQHPANFQHSFEQVLLQLNEPHSLLRSGSDVQLVTRILLNRTRTYLQVVSLYKAAVVRLQYMMKDRDNRNKDSLIGNVALAKKELQHLDRLIEPVLTQVVPKLRAAVLDEMSDSPDQIIVEDQVKEMEHILSQFAPDCAAQVDTCDHMIAEYDRAANDKTNSMLNILTVITFVIIPVQLLSGIYGMNFKRMPELNWGDGYGYFWILAGSLTLIFAILLSCIYRYAT